MRILFFSFVFSFLIQFSLGATDGKWIPLLLSQLNEVEMQSMSMKMTTEDIYSVNNGSLKDAIVHFGGFCTGDVISGNGLVLTSHHCGYGQIQSHSNLETNYQTYLSGVVAKYQPGDYEFDVPGRLPVCFLGSNHTTGGNSGSPAIDAYGNRVGLNFDRTWHGTMSEINYDPSICRNIMFDARYILFLIDKFAGAGHLVEELTLVHPKE